LNFTQKGFAMRIITKSSYLIGLTSCLFAGPVMATVIFNDTFTNGSVLEPASFTTPTSDSAGYDIASNQNATTSSIASGDLNLDSAKSSNAITEVQTVFTESPVSLSAVGSKIDLILTFKDTAGVMVSGSSTIPAVTSAAIARWHRKTIWRMRSWSTPIRTMPPAA
jgi:hypothetical protein